MNKTNAEAPILPVTNANKNVQTHNENELSLKNTESMGSNIEILESAVRTKNNKFQFGNYCLY